MQNTLVAQKVKNQPIMWETQVRSLGQEDPLEKDNPLQNSCLANPRDRRAWWATVPGVAAHSEDIFGPFMGYFLWPLATDPIIGENRKGIDWLAHFQISIRAGVGT